jgi:membrane associated rhomboid family serine protease
MGIYDRDYYRDGSGGFNPFSSRMQACIGLVVVYFIVWFVQIATREDGRPRRGGVVTEALVLQSSKVMEGEVWRMATYAFAHNPLDVISILFNVIFLIWFGRQIEDIYGLREFLSFYLLAGLLAGAGFFLVVAAGPNDPVLIGPGGSITAVLVLFALHYPRRTVLLFFVLPVPVWFLVAFYVLQDALGLFSGYLHPSAFAAHAVAAGFAFIYHRYSVRVSTWLPRWSGTGGRKRRPKTKLQIYREQTVEESAPSPVAAPLGAAKPSAASAPATTATQADMDEHLEAKLDEVLEKVKKHGQESLTDEERGVLFRASEIYRKRRKQIGER